MEWLEAHPILVSLLVGFGAQIGAFAYFLMRLRQGMDALSDGFKGINARLDILNGRVGRLEQWRAYERGRLGIAPDPGDKP